MVFVQIFQILLSIGALIVAILAFIRTKTARRTESYRLIKESVNLLNTLALQNDENLRIADRITAQESNENDTVEEIKERWIGFIILNVLESIYLAKHYGELDHDYAENALDKLLPKIVSNDKIFNLLKKRGYDQNFVHYCENIKR